MATEAASNTAEPNADQPLAETAHTEEKVESAQAIESTEKDDHKADLRRDRESYRSKRSGRNNRSSYEGLPESSDHDEIRRQVEFYWSDSNLPLDKHMLALTGGSKNKSVPISTIHQFKRMRHFQPRSVVKEALSKSELLEVKDDEIARKVALDERYTDDVDKNRKIAQQITTPRVVYVKGFGEEYDTLQLDIETFFEPYGPINAVRMRRRTDGNFKGSVYVEFESDKLAEQFLALEEHPKFVPSTKKEDAEGPADQLKIMSKKAYFESKGLDPEVDDESAYRTRQQNRPRGGGRGGRGGRGRGDRHSSRNNNIDRDDWKKRRDHDQRGDRNGKPKQKREYRDVEPEEDGEANESKKRSRDETEASEEVPAKKAKADEEAADPSS